MVETVTEWTLSIVMIVPAALRDNANLISCALGHDTFPGQTFSVPLSETGNGPATHYGCRTAAKQAFADLVSGAMSGALPDLPWGEYGLSEQDVSDILSALVIDVRPADSMIGHFDDVLVDQGLMRIHD